MLVSAAIVLPAFVKGAVGQDPTATYSESGVPTGVPIDGDYRGALRPQLHFSPPKGFLVRRSYNERRQLTHAYLE